MYRLIDCAKKQCRCHVLQLFYPFFSVKSDFTLGSLFSVGYGQRCMPKSWVARHHLTLKYIEVAYSCNARVHVGYRSSQSLKASKPR